MIIIVPSESIATMRELLAHHFGQPHATLVLKPMTDPQIVYLFMEAAIELMQEKKLCHAATTAFQKGGLN